MSYFDLFVRGISAPDFGLLLIRSATGAFFAISGYHKLFNPARHTRLTNNLIENKIPAIGVMQWWVPGWEFLAGLMLMVGFLSAFNATVLIIICLVACCCEAAKKVEAFHPINVADRIDDYLYLPEVLYILLLAATIFNGAGKYSIDAMVF